MRLLSMMVALVVVAGCGGPAARRSTTGPYVRPGYAHNPTRSLLAVAPLPSSTPAALQFEVGLDRAFGETPNIHLRNPSSTSRNRLNADRQLLITLNRIHALQGESGLDSLLKPHEIQSLREVFLHSDYLLVPTKLEIQSRSGKTAAQMETRVYDLLTGHLLLRDHFGVRVEGTGEVGEKRAVIELAILASQSFADHLLP